MKNVSITDPIERGKIIESRLIRDGKRFFGEFMVEESVDKQVLVANAYSCGCNARCYYCASLMRDYEEGYVPDINLKYNKKVEFKAGYYTAVELLEKYIIMAKDVEENKMLYGDRAVTQFAILDCETTIGMEYIFEFLDELQRYNFENNTNYIFVIFTNGIILGNDLSLIERLEKYKDIVAVRYSIKAGNNEEFGKRLDIDNRYYSCPYRAIKKCIEGGIECQVAILNDPAIMGPNEFIEIKNNLRENDYSGEILEENLVMSRGCIERIKEHKKKYPNYKYRFSFRKNVGILCEKENNFRLAQRMRSGISRVIEEKPQIFTNSNIEKECKIETLIILVDLSRYSEEEKVAKVKNLCLKISELREILFLNISVNEIKEINKKINNVKILERNYTSLFNEYIDIENISPRDQVFAGNRITYFWSTDDKI